VKRERNELKISDFALNRSFVNWVINKEPESEQFWIEWLMSNPDMEEKIETARCLLLALQFTEECISSQQINAEWERCHRRPNQRE